MKKFFLYADRVYAVPGWLATHVLVQSFDHHPWKTRKISLSDWTAYRTGLMRMFDMNFWAAILIALALIRCHFFV